MVARLVESARQVDGAYPQDIDGLVPEHEPPRLVRLEHVYSLTDEGFQVWFSFGGLLIPNMHRYRSDIGKWEILA